jgi:uncharacterized membrane protein YfcA
LSALLAQTILGIPLSTYLLVGAVAAAVSVLAGVAGYGTGLLLPLALVPAIGAEATVPVLGVTALFTNGGRILAFRHDIDWSKVRRLALPALPGVVIGAAFNAWLSGRGVLIVLGLTLLLIVPLRLWIARRGLTLPEWAILPAGFLFGLLSGGTAGAGVILIAILGALGIIGPALIATDAAISVMTGTLKTLTFGTLGALTPSLVVFAIVIGLATVPGGFAARAILRVLPMKVHAALLDGVILLGGATLLWRAFVS